MTFDLITSYINKLQILYIITFSYDFVLYMVVPFFWRCCKSQDHMHSSLFLHLGRGNGVRGVGGLLLLWNFFMYNDLVDIYHLCWIFVFNCASVSQFRYYLIEHVMDLLDLLSVIYYVTCAFSLVMFLVREIHQHT